MPPALLQDSRAPPTSPGPALSRVIEALMAEAEAAGCYKVILDCSEENAPFYQKCGLTKKELQMVRALPGRGPPLPTPPAPCARL